MEWDKRKKMKADNERHQRTESSLNKTKITTGHICQYVSEQEKRTRL